MATEQLPESTMLVGGQVTLSGWTVTDEVRGFVEETENKYDAAGKFLCKITYSRLQTLSVTLEALAAADIDAYAKGGTVVSGVFPKMDGSTATAWYINDAKITKTRGPTVVTLDLVALTDDIT